MPAVPARWILSSTLLAGAAPVALAGQQACADLERPVAMEMLLEKTIFNVDVLTVSVSVGGPEADSLRALQQEAPRTERTEDAVARVAISATCANSHLDFHRNISVGQLTDAIRDSSRAARDAGFIDDDTYLLIDRSLPEWYVFLDDRGVREGDRMSYDMRGDSLRIRYRAADGSVLLDQTDVDADRRRSVLAGYFAPGSDFRDGLIESLLDAPTGVPGTEAGGGRRP